MVVPRALLNHWEGPQVGNSGNDDGRDADDESFNASEVAARAARHVRLDEAQSSTVTSDIPGQTRRRGATLDNRPTSSSISIPARARSLNLGGRGRSNSSGHPNPADPSSYPHNAGLPSISEVPRSSAGQSFPQRPTKALPLQTVGDEHNGPQPSAVLKGSDLENTFVLESLNAFTFPSTNGESRREPITYTEGDALEDQESPPQTRPPIVRDQSDQSRFSTRSITRRASIIVNRTVEGVQNAVAAVLHPTRRSSVAEMYEKAKVRQTKIKRSPTAQYAFEYSCYTLILAIIYFVFIGIPLWKGVVWYIYIVFMRYLVVPAGTAGFLGIGFL